MTKKDNKFRKLQRFVRDNARSAKKRFDDSDLSGQISEKATAAGKVFKDSYTKSGLGKAVKPVAGASSKAIDYTLGKAVDLDESLKVRAKVKSAKAVVVKTIAEPTKQYLDDNGVTNVIVRVGRSAGDVYGTARGYVKPYFEPEDARELLENTRKELTYITACILQISYKEAEGWLGEFGKLLSAKIAGVAGTVTLFGLVSTFGTAGTGTAIASLSGAAATNATLASIGSLVGGGMAAGALVMSGVGILIGIGAYKLLASEARDFDTLPDEDKQIVSTAGTLLAAIQEQLDQDEIELTAEEASVFVEKTLVPFHEYLEEHAETICSRLDNKNALAYRQHVLKDFQPVVIEGFRHYVRHVPVSVEAIIGGVFYALITHTVLDGSSEELFVLEALRRSTASLEGASEADLAAYLDSLSPEQLRGVANNVKGIYHEMRWVEEYNATHTDSYATMHQSTTHQGSDVQIFSKETGDLLEEYQLKSTGSTSYVRDHLEKYSDIEVLATTEASSVIDGVKSSGFSNAENTANVGGVFDKVADNTLTDRITDSAELAGLVSAGREALALLNGETKMGEAGKRTLGTVVQAATATGITAFLFS
ncbi:hypothetical protein H2508_01430 [Parahaliea sp. F7430]|uniref:Uncharacterized protein n=1 Tax=Sediminihaliea albiluteola TaxID=2758564 RepID=A0A7W2YIQ5_9GAMM|nr:hypothetical protein [Sediminihaliea albiluteola]MBA6411769.1 hypothetical protein [Sediminihaliea albiluteola]